MQQKKKNNKLFLLIYYIIIYTYIHRYINMGKGDATITTTKKSKPN